MDEEQEQSEALRLLEQRVDVIQRKIAGLLEQQKQIEAEISHYRTLLRQYRGVYEAETLGLGYRPPLPDSIKAEIEKAVNLSSEKAAQKKELPTTAAGLPIRSVFKAVLIIMTESGGQPLHGTQIHEKVMERYPEVVQSTKAKNSYSAVVAALNRGAKQDLYERLEPNVYRMKPREVD
jgi:hypothetical protein